MNRQPVTMADYLDLALRATGLPTDSQLAKKLGVTRAHVSALRAGDVHPSEALLCNVIALIWPAKDAHQAKMRNEALLLLNSWRAKDLIPRKAYEEMLAWLRKTAAAIGLAFLVSAAGGTIPSPANAFATSGHASGQAVYYGK